MTTQRTKPRHDRKSLSAVMPCPKCGGQRISILETRDRKSDNTIYRRRECGDCLFRFSTSEAIG
jgi:transcriptional regulator NrdR family protein